jgi:hypothetical protein
MSDPVTLLDAYLSAKKIGNEAFAATIRDAGGKATDGWVSQIRNGKACGRKLAQLIERLTDGAVPWPSMLIETAPDTAPAGGAPAAAEGTA